MPKMDKTGPAGKGPNTGRGFGGCDKPLNSGKFKKPSFTPRVFKDFGNRGRKG